MFLIIDNPPNADDAAAYMNKAQLQFFRDLLTRTKEATLITIHQIDLAEAEATNDPIDQAAQEQDRRAESRGFERSLQQLRDIDLALKRIDDEEFGFCAATGEPIGIERLLAQPTALLCFEAQELSERRSKYHRRAA